MQLGQILKSLNYATSCDINDINITSLCFDDRQANKGSLFFCLNGQEKDGHNYAQNAVKNGAAALVVEHYVDANVPQILVQDARTSMALISANFYNNPADKLKIIGVSGTNGKTSTTYIIAQILKTAGYKVGVIGTIGVVVNDKRFPSTMTTPDPTAFHQILAQMVENKVDYVVMEVSAHALALKKMAGIKFEVGVLTNITQDHLDYFKTFSHYANTKLDFISPKYCKSAVVNLDDHLVCTLFEKYQNTNFLCRGFGLNNKQDATCNNFCINADGIKFSMQINGHNLNCSTNLRGKFNLYNIMGAVVACKNVGIADCDICKGVETIQPITGRFDVMPLFNGASVVIDYAHTPDGLQKILTSAREICQGKLISVFGCGGNRDKTKRPIMGKISAQIADYTIITSDNPRYEKPLDIILQVKKGVDDRKNLKCIIDRQEAIQYAVSISKQNDILVVSGKGAEDYLEIKGQKIPYSDYEVIKQINNKEVHL
ncbi:MAG: UDP-N-acetylmuramoyl-L-alanyl-D-glutamate--2,6-diaminopimelate ligase [Clostridia bacterium]|nr:UDP-N-acetylmuramoyl-L-alanyl-D-glutamate--2,6-diaminopimelate ligase [Clostridia bacterium]